MICSKLPREEKSKKTISSLFVAKSTVEKIFHDSGLKSTGCVERDTLCEMDKNGAIELSVSA
jgi:hypothetical protein